MTATSLLAAASLLAAGARERPIGILVLTDGASVLEAPKKTEKDKPPIREALAADQRAIQRAIDALEAQRVRKIVVVPVQLSSHGAAMDHLRYLLGIRKEPSSEFLTGTHARSSGGVNRTVARLKFKTPVVLMRGLDDDPAAIALVADRARAQSREPDSEALLAVIDVSAGDEKNSQWLGTLNNLVEGARRAARLPRARLALLREGAPSAERDKARKELVKLARELKKEGAVIVVPLGLVRGSAEARLPKILEGIMVRYDGKPLIPQKGHKGLASWIQASAEEGAKLPDMRTFKDAGRPMAQEKRLKGPKRGG